MKNYLLIITATLLCTANVNAFDFGNVLNKALEKTIDKTTDKVTESVSDDVSNNVNDRVKAAMDGRSAAPQDGSLDTQALMQNAQQAQTCFGEIDQAALDKLDQDGRKIQAQVKSLCSSGQRAQAQKEAIAFSRKMMGSNEIKKIRECGESFQGMMPQMPYDNIEEKYEQQHVCDEI